MSIKHASSIAYAGAILARRDVSNVEYLTDPDFWAKASMYKTARHIGTGLHVRILAADDVAGEVLVCLNDPHSTARNWLPVHEFDSFCL